MYIDFNDTAELVRQCEFLSLEPDDYLLVCLARNNEPQLDEILWLLSSTGIRFFGGVFPGLIDGHDVRENGAVIQSYKLVAEPLVARIDGVTAQWASPPLDISGLTQKPTCLVLADFSCVAVTGLLEDLFNRHGDNVNYFGAGAGNGTRSPSPVLFSHHGRFSGAAITAYILNRADVHLRHGWSRNSGAVIATKTEGNIVKELNWEPAMSVYRSLVGDQIADSLGRGEDVPEAKRNPFGIAREDLEDVVRDPLLEINDGELMVLSGVPENSVMHTMRADNDKLIASAQELGNLFCDSDGASSCLLFDCYSRAKLLADDFPKELHAFVNALNAKQPSCRVEGALALGEISSDGNRLPDFHNKTIAAGLFYGAT
jgi:hypothetical protein